MPPVETTESIEPRPLTVRDKVFLSLAFAITLIRVAGLLGAAFNFMFFGFSYAFDPTPSINLLVNIGWFLALYVVSTMIMHYMSKRTYS